MSVVKNIYWFGGHEILSREMSYYSQPGILLRVTGDDILPGDHFHSDTHSGESFWKRLNIYALLLLRQYLHTNIVLNSTHTHTL